MKFTVGPHPPAVYWRRRAILAAPILLILVLISSCLASGSDDGAKPKAGAKPSASTDAESGTAGSTPGDCTQDNPCETIMSPSLAPSPGAGAALPVAPPLVAESPLPAPRPAVKPAAKPAVCSDADMELTVSSDRTSYKAGAVPKFTMVITNRSAVPCVRDVGARHQELRVMAGERPVWSSDHCSPKLDDDVRTLKPGEKRTYWLFWSARTSAEGCPNTRQLVEAGTFQLIGRLEGKMSAPRSFIVTR